MDRKEYKHEHYLANREKYRALAKERYQRDKGTPEFLEQQRRHAKLYADRHPEKVKARYTLRHAINYHKILERGLCYCGKSGEAHHSDYSKPFDVEWLCSDHHKEKHFEERVEERIVQ